MQPRCCGTTGCRSPNRLGVRVTTLTGDLGVGRHPCLECGAAEYICGAPHCHGCRPSRLDVVAYQEAVTTIKQPLRCLVRVQQAARFRRMHGNQPLRLSSDGWRGLRPHSGWRIVGARSYCISRHTLNSSHGRRQQQQQQQC